MRFRKQPKENYVDAAVAALDAAIEFEPAELRGIGTLAGPASRPLDVREPVHKVGRTTGARDGRVTAIELDGVLVEYDTGVFSLARSFQRTHRLRTGARASFATIPRRAGWRR